MDNCYLDASNVQLINSLYDCNSFRLDLEDGLLQIWMMIYSYIIIYIKYLFFLKLSFDIYIYIFGFL